MDLGIKDKVALVQGAGGGLGGAIAQALAAEGARVMVCDLSEKSAQLTVSRIRDAGHQAHALQWDLADLDSYDAKLEHIQQLLGPVSILVNNTGGPPPNLLGEVSVEQWQKHFQSMVLSVIQLTEKVLPGMRAANWGRIITSTSSGVIAPIPNLGVSNALRSTLVGWSKTLAREVAADQITANIILPGRIATSRIHALDVAKAQRENRSVESVSQESTASIPMRRYGKPSEYGSTVAYLASEQASYITGSILRVDGGLINAI